MTGHNISADPSMPVEDRVQDLLNRMTLEEKAAQTAAPFGAAVDVHRPPPTGWGNATAAFSSLGLTPREAARAGNELQRKHVEGTRLGIPVLLAEEALIGLKVRDATTFPDAIAQAATWDPELVAEMARRIGTQMASLGVRQALSPLADVARDPRWGRVEETYGEDPYLVGTMATAFVHGLQGAVPGTPLIATLKHFVGYSASDGGRNTGPAQLGPRELREVHTLPFEMAIRVGGARGAMPAYNSIDGVPVTGSRAYLTDLLRDELGFDGIVISDLGAVAQLHNKHHTAEDIVTAFAQALPAGVDLDLDNKVSSDQIADAVRAGVLDEVDLDRAVANVLRAKFRIGLFERPYVDVEAVPETLDSAEDRALARKIAEQSTVLLQNQSSGGRPLLPLSHGLGTIAVIGPNADRPMGQLGNYSYQVLDSVTQRFSLAGDPQARPEEVQELVGNLSADDAELLVESVPIVSFLDGIRRRVGAETTVMHEAGCPVAADDRSGIPAAVEAATAADVAVLVVGDQAGINGFGTVGEGLDSAECALPGVQRELVEAVVATGTPTVVVLSHGRPYVLGWMAELVPAIVTGFFGGEESGNAMAAVLFGDVNPAGRLPMAMLRTAGAAPAPYSRTTHGREYVDGSAGALFPFGHGLSYTQFEYRDLEIDRETEPTEGVVDLSFTIANVGDRAGDEVVQVYGQDVVGRTARPGRKLVAFRRLHLEPNEGARVSVSVPSSMFALWDTEEGWVVEPGVVKFFVGASSAAIRLRGEATLTGEVHHPGSDRPLVSTIDAVPDGRMYVTADFEAPETGAFDRSIAPVSATNTVREWLDHPVGGFLLRKAFGGPDFDEDTLALAFDLPLGQLVVLSGGRFPQSLLDDLLAAMRQRSSGATTDGDAHGEGTGDGSRP
jgi:beta-glucosidase-like glycosyl hydrolase